MCKTRAREKKKILSAFVAQMTVRHKFDNAWIWVMMIIIEIGRKTVNCLFKRKTESVEETIRLKTDHVTRGN